MKGKTLLELLEEIHNYVIKGHKILSDPIVSHIESSSNPFKTILISKYPAENNMSSLDIIGGVLQIAEKLPAPLPLTTDENILEEFRFIDLNLIINSIKELN